MKILIVGGGSIGQRHLKNLIKLGIRDIVLVETSQSRRKELRERFKKKVYSTLKQALREDLTAALICTPPNSHLKIGQKIIEHNIPLFIEKPLSHNLKGVPGFIKKAKSKKIKVLVGYNFRFHPGLCLVKNLLGKNKIGRVLSVRIETGQYLPDWHPQEDYRKGYQASKKMGGGIILDGSHEIDYLLWLLAEEPKEIFCLADKLSGLEVETEDTAEILLRFKSGTLANLHLDFTQRIYSRGAKLIGEKGTIIWDYPSNKVKVYLAAKKKWQVFNLKFKTNDMYLEEMKHFLRVIQGKEKPKTTPEQAKRVLEICLLAKKSSALGRKIKI